MLSFKNEDASSKKVSIQDETGKSKDQPSETSGAATPQSSAPEEGTGEVKGIKYYLLSSTDLKGVRLANCDRQAHFSKFRTVTFMVSVGCFDIECKIAVLFLT